MSMDLYMGIKAHLDAKAAEMNMESVDAVLSDLRSRVEYANAVHPEGPSLGALCSECEELRFEVERGHVGRSYEEAIDVATVAVRLALECIVNPDEVGK